MVSQPRSRSRTRAELHLSDTLAAGAGLCDPDAVRVLVTEGPDRVRELMMLGAVFDRTGDGAAASLALAREGGHSVARVVHAGGDATGAEIERALVAAVHALDGVEVREQCFAVDLIVERDRCVGVRDPERRRCDRGDPVAPHDGRHRWRGPAVRGHDEPAGVDR